MESSYWTRLALLTLMTITHVCVNRHVRVCVCGLKCVCVGASVCVCVWAQVWVVGIQSPGQHDPYVSSDEQFCHFCKAISNNVPIKHTHTCIHVAVLSRWALGSVVHVWHFHDLGPSNQYLGAEGSLWKSTSAGGTAEPMMSSRCEIWGCSCWIRKTFFFSPTTSPPTLLFEGHL